MESIFTHKTCHSVIYLDLAEHLKIIATVNPGKNVMVATRGDVISSGEVTPADYYCPECKKGISIDDILCKCIECGENFPLKDIYKGTPGGYIVCSRCKESYPGREWKPMIKIASKVSTKNL